MTTAIDPAVIENLRRLNQDGEPDVVREVLALFLTDADVRMDAVAAAIEDRNSDGVQRAAHTLKGAAASIGAHAFQEQCRELETLGIGGTFEGAPALLQAMREEFARVRTEAERLLAPQCGMIDGC